MNAAPRRDPQAGPTRADALVAGAALAYLVWSFVPRWYVAEPGRLLGIPVPGYRFNAWGGPTAPAAVIALVALAWVGLRVGGARLAGGSLGDLLLAGAALLLTVVGLLLGRPATTGTASASWGLWVGLGLSAAWAAAAWWRLRRARSGRFVHIPGGGFTR